MGCKMFLLFSSSDLFRLYLFVQTVRNTENNSIVFYSVIFYSILFFPPNKTACQCVITLSCSVTQICTTDNTLCNYSIHKKYDILDFK